MLSSEMLCHGPSERRFVVPRVRKTDTEGFNGALTLSLHQGDYCGRVNATGKKCANRHVGDHLHCDRLVQQLIESIGRSLGVSPEGMSQTTFQRGRKGPVVLNGRCFLILAMNRLELEN